MYLRTSSQSAHFKNCHPSHTIESSRMSSPPPKKRLQSRQSALVNASVPATPTISGSELDVTSILDMRYETGKQYLAEINGVAEPQWIRHRKLSHVRHLVDAFHQHRERQQDAILDTDREPDLIFGYTRDPITEDGVFLIKWRQLDDCHLVRASRVYAKYPALAIAWFEQRLLSNAVGQEELGLDRMCEALAAVEGTSSGDRPVYTSVDRYENPAEIVEAIYENNALLFLMRWEDCKETDFVLASEANVTCPEVVLRFYESRIKK